MKNMIVVFVMSLFFVGGVNAERGLSWAEIVEIETAKGKVVNAHGDFVYPDDPSLQVSDTPEEFEDCNAYGVCLNHETGEWYQKDVQPQVQSQPAPRVKQQTKTKNMKKSVRFGYEVEYDDDLNMINALTIQAREDLTIGGILVNEGSCDVYVEEDLPHTLRKFQKAVYYLDCDVEDIMKLGLLINNQGYNYSEMDIFSLQ